MLSQRSLLLPQKTLLSSVEPTARGCPVFVPGALTASEGMLCFIEAVSPGVYTAVAILVMPQNWRVDNLFLFGSYALERAEGLAHEPTCCCYKTWALP